MTLCQSTNLFAAPQRRRANAIVPCSDNSTTLREKPYKQRVLAQIGIANLVSEVQSVKLQLYVRGEIL